MGRLRWRFAAAVAAAVWLLPGASDAQSAESIVLDVMVSQISQQPGSVDPRAKRIDEKLRGEFRYESLRVLKEERLPVKMNELASVDLPNGRELQLRPLSISDRGVLMAVSIEGLLQTDMQIPNGHLVAIGAGRYQDGKLVISLEPHF